MPPRSPLDTLPEPVLTELNQRLIASGFAGYVDLAAWLTEQGFTISKSAVHRHGSALQASMEKSINRARERMEIAKALKGASDEDKAALMEANEMVAMDQIMDLFDMSADMEPGERITAIPKLVRAIADLNRSAIGSSKWKREFEAETKRQAREEAAQAATHAAKAEGVSETGLARIREALGMAA